jgi:anthraniloyl-CoA monooxygenase
MSKEESIAACERIFRDHLGGHALISNAITSAARRGSISRACSASAGTTGMWCSSATAAATAHFSIGSGTKLALESAIALADLVHSEPTMEAAFRRYEEERRVEVLRLQSAARNSMEWFEEVERYLSLDPVQFNYSLLTRSQRISHENLRVRDKNWLEGAEAWFQRGPALLPTWCAALCSRPIRCATCALKIASSSPRWTSTKRSTGCPTDWHLVHYGERAKGGAGWSMSR